MNRLFEIAERMKTIAGQRFELRMALLDVETQIAERTRALTPPAGWPGKNQSECDAAELAACGADELLVDLNEERAGMKFDLGALETDKECLEAELQAWTWTIRDQENVAKGLPSVFYMKDWNEKIMGLVDEEEHKLIYKEVGE